MYAPILGRAVDTVMKGVDGVEAMNDSCDFMKIYECGSKYAPEAVCIKVIPMLKEMIQWPLCR